MTVQPQNFSDDRMTGVLAAALTPMKSDLTPDDELLFDHCQWLLADGCDGIAVLGTTGEANSFCLKERIRIVESLVDKGIKGDQLMPGTGSSALTEAVIMTKSAVDFGAKGVLVLPPFYYKEPSDDGLFAYYSEIIQRIADDRLKIYLYHFPQMSMIPISQNLIKRLIQAYPNTVVGMKDSSGDFANMKSNIDMFPGFAVFSGADNLLLDAVRSGGAGCITATANVAAKLLAEIYRAAKTGADTPAAHELICDLHDATFARPFIAGLKYWMAQHMNDDRWFNIRPPLEMLDGGQKSAHDHALDVINFKITAKV